MLGILKHQKEAPAETLIAEVPRGMRGNGPRSILRRREDPGLEGRGPGGNPMTTMGWGSDSVELARSSAVVDSWVWTRVA